jgi:hypothetical protein
MLILLLPTLIFAGLAGWCMYALDDNHKTTQHKLIKTNQKDSITLLPIFLKDQQEKGIYNST